MIAQTSGDLRQVFVAFVRDWLGILSRGDLWTAASMIDAANSDDSIRWGPQEIEEALREYKGSAQTPKVSDPSTVAGDGRSNFGEFEDGSGFWLDYAVPLDDEWSDLTVQFEFLREGTAFKVVVQSIHVL